jgi:hypothetical protein
MSFRDKKELIHGFQCINTDNGIAVIDCRIYAGKAVTVHKSFPQYGYTIGRAAAFLTALVSPGAMAITRAVMP